MDLKTMMFLKTSSAKEPETEEATASGNPATFTTDIVKPLAALSVTFSPMQEGSGDPAPDNVRNISGISSIKVSVSDGESTPTDYTTSLGNTYYGGTLDVLTGVLTVEWEMASARWGDIIMDGPSSTTGYYHGRLMFTHDIQELTESEVYGSRCISNVMHTVLWAGGSTTPEHFFLEPDEWQDRRKKCQIYGNFDNDQIVQVVAKVRQPFTVQLTAQQVTDILGANSISANTNGTVTLTYLKIKSEGD